MTIPFFAPLVREITDGIASLTAPMLVVANPAAIFALCDALVNAERVYLTVPELAHNDFISQGQQRFARIARSPQATPADTDAAAAARYHYRVVCDRVLQFFDASLRDDQAAAANLTETVPWDPAAPCVVRVPRGATSPASYDSVGEIPPTPRQFVRLLATPGIEQACQALERSRLSAPHSSPPCRWMWCAGLWTKQKTWKGNSHCGFCISLIGSNPRTPTSWRNCVRRDPRGVGHKISGL